MVRPEEQAIVGRAAELATVRALLRRVHGGTPAVLIVGGEAGVGKTRLIEATVAEAVALGFRTATGTCLRMESGVMPYAAIVGALRQLVHDGDPVTIATTLGTHRREVARLLPEVARIATPVASARSGQPTEGGWTAGPAGTVSAGLPPTTPGDPAPDAFARLRLFEALAGWLERLAAVAPLLLVIEDLQWADLATLDVVRSLALGPAGRVLLAVTVRTDEPLGPGVGTAVAELVRDGATRLELGPLGRLDLAALAAAALPGTGGLDGEEALNWITERSGGNPFVALELIGAGLLAPDGTPYPGVPPSLRDILDARLASLEDSTLLALRAAALHPGPIDDEVLAAVLNLPVGVVGDALREAREAGVLAAGPGAPRFRHALQRDALAEQLGPGERRMFHGRFADALMVGSQDTSRATAVALHRDAAGDDAGSLTAHVAALGAAERALAFEAATRHGSRAGELRERVGAGGGGLPDAAALYERGSIAAFLAGDPQRSADLARAALALVDDDDERAATLHDRLRWALWEAGDRDGARREVELAVARLAGVEAANLRTRLTAQQAAMRMDEADPGPALALADAAIRASRAIGAPDIEAIALGVRGRTLSIHGQVDEGLASMRAAVRIADGLDSLQGRLVGGAAIVTVLARCGRARDALVEAEATLVVADACGLGRSLGAQLQAQAARAAFSIGAWDEADRHIADGLGRRPSALPEAHLRIVALRLAAARGRGLEADTFASRLALLEPLLTDPEDRAALDVARADVALARDRPAEVRRLVDRALATIAEGAERGSSLAWLGALAVRAEVDLAIDAAARRDAAGGAEARARIASIADVARREASAVHAYWGPRTDALLAEIEAEQSRLEAPPGPRATAWERAIRAWDAIERPYTAAYARFRLAEARLAGGVARAGIAEPLRIAAQALRELDARPLLARVDRLARLARLDITGTSGHAANADVREPGDAAGGRDPLAALALTPREREVLRLVAAGWENSRIADRLGISVKTASVHVSNILGKLDVRNRVEAAALAHRLGVIGDVGD